MTAANKQLINRSRLAVVWQGPGISQPVIDGTYLTPWYGLLVGDITNDDIVNNTDQPLFVEP